MDPGGCKNLEITIFLTLQVAYRRSGSRGQSHIRGLSARLMTSKEVKGWRSGTSSSWFPSRKRLLNPGPRPARECCDIWSANITSESGPKRVTLIPLLLLLTSKACSPSPAPRYPDTAPSATSPQAEKRLAPPTGWSSQTAVGL